MRFNIYAFIYISSIKINIVNRFFNKFVEYLQIYSSDFIKVLFLIFYRINKYDFNDITYKCRNFQELKFSTPFN